MTVEPLTDGDGVRAASLTFQSDPERRKLNWFGGWMKRFVKHDYRATAVCGAFWSQAFHRPTIINQSGLRGAAQSLNLMLKTWWMIPHSSNSPHWRVQQLAHSQPWLWAARESRSLPVASPWQPCGCPLIYVTEACCLQPRIAGGCLAAPKGGRGGGDGKISVYNWVFAQY